VIRCLRIVSTAAAYCLVAVVYLWFAPVLLLMLMDGTWDRYELQRRNNEYWFRRHGFDHWERQQEQQRRKRRKKKWKNRNNFYKT
jgi:cytochrome c-type biogenesis protein CcmH/NrfF